jgi:hypothetical protein
MLVIFNEGRCVNELGETNVSVEVPKIAKNLGCGISRRWLGVSL